MNEDKLKEYIDSVYKEKYVATFSSWIFDVIAFDYDDGMKTYIGLEYNKAWPEPDWFYVVLKTYNEQFYEPPTLYHDVQMWPNYRKRKANDKERKLLLEELYKKGWKVERIDDDGFVEYKVKKLNIK